MFVARAHTVSLAGILMTKRERESEVRSARGGQVRVTTTSPCPSTTTCIHPDKSERTIGADSHTAVSARGGRPVVRLFHRLHHRSAYTRYPCTTSDRTRIRRSLPPPPLRGASDGLTLPPDRFAYFPSLDTPLSHRRLAFVSSPSRVRPRPSVDRAQIVQRRKKERGKLMEL